MGTTKKCGFASNLEMQAYRPLGLWYLVKCMYVINFPLIFAFRKKTSHVSFLTIEPIIVYQL